MADNLRDVRDAATRVLHEAVGHLGVTQAFGPTFEGFLDELIAQRSADVALYARRYGLDMERLADRRVAAEELLAHLAETQAEADLPFLRRVFQAIRAWLRAQGFAWRLTDGDLREILAGARRYIERGDARAALRVRERFGVRGGERSTGARLAGGLDPNRQVVVTELRGDEIAAGPLTWKQAAEYARTHFRRNHYLNQDTGARIEVVAKGVDEAAHYSKTQADLQSFAAIPQLIERAVLVAREPDKLGRYGIRAVDTFYAPIRVAGELRRAKLTVRETIQGGKYYGHRLEALEIEEPGVSGVEGQTAAAVSGIATRQPGSTISLDDLLAGSKDRARLSIGRAQESLKLEDPDVIGRGAVTREGSSVVLRPPGSTMSLADLLAGRQDGGSRFSSAKEKAPAFAADMQAQTEFLEREAKSRHFGSLDEFAAQDLTTFAHLAEQWREGHPAERLAMEDAARGDTRATLDDARITRLLNEHGYDHRPQLSNAWLAWVNPRDFLAATTPDAQMAARIERQSPYVNRAMLTSETQTPFLQVQDGEIRGHEGRHRLAAMAQQGIESVPVVLINWGGMGPARASHASIALSGQQFGPQRGQALIVRDAVPLSYAEEPRLRAQFGGESALRFSLASRLAPTLDAGGSPIGGGRRLWESIKSVVDGTGAWAGDAWRGALPQTLRAVTLRQLDDLGRPHIPGIEGYTREQQRMDTRRNAMVEESGVFAGLWESWARKKENRAQAEEAASLMHAATLAQVDPSDYKVLTVALQLGPGELFYRNREATKKNVQELIGKARQLTRSTASEDRGMAGYYSAAAKKLKAVVWAEKRRRAALPELERRWAALSDGRIFDDGGKPYATREAAEQAIDARAKEFKGRVVFARERFGGGWDIQEMGGRQAFTLSRDMYKKRSEAMMAALIARVQESEALDDASKTKLAKQIRQEFEQTVDEKGNPRIGPYFPLQRFGRFYAFARRFPTGTARTFVKLDGEPFASEAAARGAIGKRADLRGIEAKPVALEDGSGWVLKELGEPWFGMFESIGERRAALAGLRADGWTIERQGLTQEANQQLEGVTEGFMAEAVAKLKARGAEDEADMLYQMYLNTLHQMAIRKHFVHRKGTAGFSNDALRAFGWNMMRLANQVAKLEHVPRLERLLREIEDEKKASKDDKPEGDVTVADAFFKELQKRHKWIVSPDNAAWTNFTSGLGFAFYLGASPAAALVNLTQTPILALPVLASRFGWKGASGALGKAFLDVSRGFSPGVVKGFLTGKPRPSEAANLTGDERAAFAAWDLSGVRDRTQAHNLAGIGDTDTFWNGPTFNRGMAIISSGFHAAEVVNRDVTLLAAYRLGRAAGMGHQEALQAAEDATWAAHFDYSNANRARWMQSNAAKALLMFKSYGQHMTYFMWRNLYQSLKGESKEVRHEARTKFLGVMGMTGLFAGTLGLPMLGMLFAVANLAAAAFGDDDEPWDAETEFRNWLTATFPRDVADILDRGAVTKATGLDWASRVSLRALWWRSPDRDLNGAGTFQHIVEQLMGPLGGIAGGPFTAFDLIQEGHWERAAEAVVPKAIKDVLRAGRFATEGVLTKRGDPIIEREGLNAYQILWKAMGMNPDAIAVRQDANAAVKLYEGRIKDRRSRLMTAYALATLHGDQEAQAHLLPQIRAFNAAQPALPITPRVIRTSVRNRERAALQAAQEHGMAINRRLAPEVREAGAFGE